MEKSEFISVFAELFPNGDATEFSAFVFDTSDLNVNGSIEFDEFIQALAIVSNTSSAEDKLRWAFTLYDLDNNGAISKSEMMSVLRSVYALVKDSAVYRDELTMCSLDQRVERVFHLIDEDHNGMISKSEFVKHAMVDPVVMAGLSLYDRESNSSEAEATKRVNGNRILSRRYRGLKLLAISKNKN